jgi:CRISPR-associated protein Csb3
MAEHSIPVDLFNPGQVFACLGFLEAADILLGDAEGGFDWSDETEVRFFLRTAGEENPAATVLQFLAELEVVTLCPEGIEGPWPEDAKRCRAFPAPKRALRKSNGKELSASTLPVLLKHKNDIVPISHWLEIDDRPTLKLFAGQQVGSRLATNMLEGDPKKKDSMGVRDIFQDMVSSNFEDPFSIKCAVGGRFGFDARGAWDAIRIGTSLDEQGVSPNVSPHLEILAAIGLEHTRPLVPSTYHIRYAAWKGLLPISLCRVALFAPDAFLPRNEHRKFRAHLGDDKQYKKVFFAEEEPVP